MISVYSFLGLQMSWPTTGCETALLHMAGYRWPSSVYTRATTRRRDRRANVKDDMHSFENVMVLVVLPAVLTNNKLFVKCNMDSSADACLINSLWSETALNLLRTQIRMSTRLAPYPDLPKPLSS